MCDPSNRGRFRSEFALTLVVWIAWLVQVWFVIAPWLFWR
jgi:hypothetical protein